MWKCRIIGLLHCIESNKECGIAKGNDGPGSLLFLFCPKSGRKIYLSPREQAKLRPVMATNFHIEHGVSCKLPEE